MRALQAIRSLVFMVTIYAWMLVAGILFLPWALFSPSGAFAAAHTWSRGVRFLAQWMVGIKTEVRGIPPTNEVVVAAKHQSFLDIILIYASVPRGKFIMKREMLWTPIIGLYALRIGCVPVHRGKGGAAVKQMVDGVHNSKVKGGQLIIYPQGTRVPPGEHRPFKIGSGILYSQLGQDCVPVACNVGLFWPKKGMLYHPGTAVIEFLPRIAAGKPVEVFMAELEDVVENRSNALMREAGFDPEA